MGSVPSRCVVLAARRVVPTAHLRLAPLQIGAQRRSQLFGAGLALQRAGGSGVIVHDTHNIYVEGHMLK